MAARCWLVGVLLGALLAACSEGAAPRGTADAGSATSSTPRSAAPSRPAPTASGSPSGSQEAPSPSPSTLPQRIRALERDRTPRAREIIALATWPTTWQVAGDHVLLGYWVPSAFDWPNPWSTHAAYQLRGAAGRVVAQWAEANAHEYVAAGRSFVGLGRGSWYGAHGDPRGAVLLRRGQPAPLEHVPGARSRTPSDLPVDHGWLVDPSRLTITRETLPPCRRGSARLDPQGRVWCLSPRKDQVLWSDDGKAWQRHRLSTSYFTFCDGGTLGADLEVLGSSVSIGQRRADFTPDRGRTWSSVLLPVDRVGAGEPPPGAEQNCARVVPLPDNRLVVSYFGSLVATDASNTEFDEVTAPPGTRFAGVREGVMLAASRRAYGALSVSYDGGRSWQPLVARELARRLAERS